MKNIFKKNQMIITALAIMIAVAGYLNYSGSKLDSAKVETDADASTGDDAEAAAAILSIVADWLPEDAGAAPGDMPGNGGTAAGGGPESRSSGLTAEQAELMNTFGVACARAGQYGTALKALDTAMQAGNGNARHNLQQLYGVIDQLD